MSETAAPSLLAQLLRVPPLVVTAGSVGLALCLMLVVAWWTVLGVERRSERVVTTALLTEGLSWADVRADGLDLHLSGEAPTEAARLKAVNVAGGVIDSGRIRDDMSVTPARAFEAPRFSVEILRNTDGMSLIGLVPVAGEAEAKLTAAVGEIAGGLPVADMLETADYAPPEGWDAALGFGIEALKLLPRAKISVSAERVAITAISGSAEEKRRLEAAVARLKPEGLTLALDISAPRPVLTPFTLRFVKDAAGARFDACSADTDRARDRIVAAAVAAGAPQAAICTVGLGVPTPRWAEAAAAGIGAVGALPGGTISFSDADVTLTAAAGTSQADFDRVAGELRAALPEVFALTATLTPSEAPAAAGPAEFTAVLTGEGRVELRGRVTDDLMREAVDSVSQARFGGGSVYNATRVDGDLPEGWPVRVLAGLEALAQLHDGRLLVRADTVQVTGVSGRQDASARIAQVLSAKLGPGQTYSVDVRYDEAFDPDAALPTPRECAADLNAVLATRKITFTPGSAEIDANARGVLDALAAILETCPPLQMEIAGHTDAQGSEGGNQSLSQARAEAVLVALQGRRLAVEGFVARGYGEASPIADNGTDEGREANRRIEFMLIGDSAAAADIAPPGPSSPGPSVPGQSSPGPAPAGAVPAPPPVVPSARPQPRPQTGAEEEPAATVVVEAPAEAGAAGVAATGALPAPVVDGADAPVQVAAAETEPDLGVTRSITLSVEGGAEPPAREVLLWAPVEETTPRPLRRTRTRP